MTCLLVCPSNSKGDSSNSRVISSVVLAVVAGDEHTCRRLKLAYNSMNKPTYAKGCKRLYMCVYTSQYTDTLLAVHCKAALVQLQ
jgi:hypothetical protein